MLSSCPSLKYLGWKFNMETVLHVQKDLNTSRNHFLKGCLSPFCNKYHVFPRWQKLLKSTSWISCSCQHLAMQQELDQQALKVNMHNATTEYRSLSTDTYIYHKSAHSLHKLLLPPSSILLPFIFFSNHTLLLKVYFFCLVLSLSLSLPPPHNLSAAHYAPLIVILLVSPSPHLALTAQSLLCLFLEHS